MAVAGERQDAELIADGRVRVVPEIAVVMVLQYLPCRLVVHGASVKRGNVDVATRSPGHGAVGAAAEVELEVIVTVAHGALPEERLAQRRRKRAHDVSVLELPVRRVGSGLIRLARHLELPSVRYPIRAYTPTWYLLRAGGFPSRLVNVVWSIYLVELRSGT